MNNLVEFLKNKSGVSFANIQTETDPVNHTKKNDALFNSLFPNHTSIIKVGNRNVSIGNNYNTAVNNRLAKTNNEPSFTVDTQQNAVPGMSGCIIRWSVFRATAGVSTKLSGDSSGSMRRV